VATYLYGLVLGRNAPRVPAGIVGIDASDVRVVDALDAQLGALVSTLEQLPARATLDAVRAHDGVLQAVVDGGSTVAAVRFGQSFASDEEARRHVTERSERTARVLETYDGCVEMRLLLARTPEHGTPAASEPPASDKGEAGAGRAYLEQLRATFAGFEANDSDVAQRLSLRAALGPVVRAERVEGLPKSGGVAFSHLIQRENEGAYRDSVAALPSLAEAVVVGPLALYTFAEAPLP
jgi:hypothetical protein